MSVPLSRHLDERNWLGTVAGWHGLEYHCKFKLRDSNQFQRRWNFALRGRPSHGASSGVRSEGAAKLGGE